MKLSARNLAFHIHSCPIIESISLEVAPGKCLAIIGPNGAGKTTLFKLLTGDLKPKSGEIQLNGASIKHFSERELAHVRAVLPQFSTVQFPVPVELMLRLARETHDTGETEDRAIITECLDWVDAAHLLQRDYSTLSGGEKQRVQIARVLAQIWEGAQPRYLFLDEPLNMLDIAHQHLCLNALQKVAQRSVGVIMILHDINLALQYADEIAVLNNGGIVTIGKPDQVITVDLLRQVFHVRASLFKDEKGAMFVKVEGNP